MSLESNRISTKAGGNKLGEFERELEKSVSPDTACVKLARILRVARSEIALLRLEKGRLRFIYPAELRDAGTIPLSGSAVAARTAVTRTSLLSNSFARVRHVSLFESVKLHDGEASEEIDPMPIQKIISVPMISGGKVVGVIQVSRKGLDPALAGTDFTTDDLKLLEQSAQILAEKPFMQDGVPVEQAIYLETHSSNNLASSTEQSGKQELVKAQARSTRARLQAAPQGLQRIQRIIQRNLFFNVVALLIEKLPRTSHDRRFRPADVLGQSRRIRLKQGCLVQAPPQGIFRS
jgi:hypothetical protein